ncbi:MAG: hypothetical protein EZS28_034959 [Streblomastix strix]|uniref:Uncharacterized protein n=1 Tax=Streblomastix strix TaxID=222440 RepID=A0A5J4UH03_9EUKA|nr:MAG: hypothetical protein EZS28_034959 [Streblomastix strix]
MGLKYIGELNQLPQQLARQTHFRGYFLLNADIVNLPASSTGDFAFSAESGTVWMYESEWYDSGQLVPDQVTPASDELPIINGTAAAGNSTSYSRGDHVHPQQLTYDNDITATKFIMAGGTATQILLANGDTTTIDSKLSRQYNSRTGGYIRLCVFPAGTSTGAPYIQFQVQCNTNAMQTIDLVPNYTVNGISALYGVFTAPSYVQTIMNIYYGVDQLLHTHTGTGSQAVYSVWIHMMSGSGMVTVSVSKQGIYWSQRVTEILTQDIVTSITGSQTQIPMSFNLGTGGIIGNMLQVNPLDRNYSSYSNGIRIGNNNNDSSSSLYLGCIKTSIITTQTGQWEISKTNDNALTINPSSLRQTDHSVGLSINGDSSKITFNGSELVNVGTDLTITGRKTFANTSLGSIQINATDVSYGEGIRISNSPLYNVSTIYIGTSSTSTSGEIDGQWTIIKRNAGELCTCRTADQITDNRGLMISADGNILSFNGSIIAGTGATSGASNGSVNYSAGNPILWGVNSVGTEGGFYSDGPKIYWRAKPVTLGAVPP